MGGGLKGMGRFCGGQDRAGISTLKNKHADASFCALVAQWSKDRESGSSGDKIKEEHPFTNNLQT